jgi:hypothetical protein
VRDQAQTRLVLETLLALHDSVADSPEAFAGYEGSEEDTERLLGELWELLQANPELTTSEELLEEWQDSVFDPELEYNSPEEQEAKLAQAFAEGKASALLKLGDLYERLSNPEQEQSWKAVVDLEQVNTQLQALKERQWLALSYPSHTEPPNQPHSTALSRQGQKLLDLLKGSRLNRADN